MDPFVDSDEDAYRWSLTSEVCAQCEDALRYDEEVVLIRVERAAMHDGHLHLEPLLSPEQDFAYEVYFLHFSCWDGILDDVKEEVRDTPPVLSAHGVLSCTACAGSIEAFETCVSITLGELNLSERAPAPHNRRGMQFTPFGPSDVLCLYCASVINEEHLTCWESGVSQEGECLECQHQRCWRGFDCQCTCHQGVTP